MINSFDAYLADKFLLIPPALHNCKTHGEYHQKYKHITECPTCHDEKVERTRKQEQLKFHLENDKIDLKEFYKYLEYANLPKRHSGCTFDNYQQTEQNKSAYNATKRFAENKDNLTKKGIGLLFLGVSGVGKTHLCAAIINHVMKEYRLVCYYCKQYEIVEMYLKDRDKFEEILEVPLLVIDEIGVSENSLTKEVMYQIVDKRYDLIVPTILVSNRTPEEFYKANSVALNSRLKEAMFELTAVGEDYRLTKGIKPEPVDYYQELFTKYKQLDDKYQEDINSLNNKKEE